MSQSRAGRRVNLQVRDAQGGNEVANEKVERLKKAWPRSVVKHCDDLLAQPMPDATFEALAAVMEWRSDRSVPEYVRPAIHPKRRGQPVRGEGWRARKRLHSRIESRALRLLSKAHPEEYQALYQAELEREQATPRS